MKRRRDYPWKRRQRYALWAMVFIVAVAALPFSYGGRLRWQIKEEYRKIYAAGEPAILGDLMQRRPMPPEDQNGSALFLEADALSRALPTRAVRGSIFTIDRMMMDHGCLPEESVEKRIQWLEEYREILQVLLEAAKRPVTRFPIEWERGPQMDNSYLDVLSGAAAGCRQAAIFYANEGYSEESVRFLSAALMTAEAVREDPTFVAQQHRMAYVRLAITGLRRMLEITSFSDEQLAQLQTIFLRQEDPEALARTLMGERVWGLKAFEDRNYFATVFYSYAPMLQYSGTPFENALRRTLSMGEALRDRLNYMRYMAELIQASERPWRASLRKMMMLDRERILATRMKAAISTVLLAKQSGNIQGFACHAAWVRCAGTALALERYRLAHGSLPPKLDDLVPLYLKAVPLDPLHGTPLCYRPSGEGYKVYSVGMNRLDNEGSSGGSAADNQRKPAEMDVIFEVQR